MPRRKRSRLEILTDILQILSTGCRNPTRLATEANLAYDRMAKIVEILVERGLVKRDVEGLCLTQEGYKFLDSYRQWRRFLDALGL